jgi:hypothetical protein
MKSSSSAINILLETKKEYTTEIVKILTPFMMKYFEGVYKDVYKQNKITKYLLREFQIELKNVSGMTDEKKNTLYEIIKEKYEWLDTIIRSIFIIRGQIITAMNHKNKPLHIKPIPSTEFIYKCYLEFAREIWKQPNIYYHKLTISERQKNINELHRLAEHCIHEVIRNTMPFKDVISLEQIEGIESGEDYTKVYYNEESDSSSDDEDEDEDDDDEDEDEDVLSEEDVDEEDISLQGEDDEVDDDEVKDISGEDGDIDEVKDIIGEDGDIDEVKDISGEDGDIDEVNDDEEINVEDKDNIVVDDSGNDGDIEKVLVTKIQEPIEEENVNENVEEIQESLIENDTASDVIQEKEHEEPEKVVEDVLETIIESVHMPVVEEEHKVIDINQAVDQTHEEEYKEFNINDHDTGETKVIEIDVNKKIMSIADDENIQKVEENVPTEEEIKTINIDNEFF